jgi:hypothetical protein
MTAGSTNVTGERMISFDLKVAAPNGSMPVSYTRGANTCALVCHDAAHFPNGTVTPLAAGGVGVRK